jgi:hypothetical protein
MSNAKKLVTVPSNGQISIGKTWAGKEVQIEQISESQIIITSGAFVPADHATFYTGAAKKRLSSFDSWAKGNPPQKTDLKELRKKLGKK